MDPFSIIIPVYNEADNIISLYEEIVNSIPSNINYEIIFVDDASTDNTNSLLTKLLDDKLVTTFNHKKNLGQSFSIISGIKNASYEIIVTIDGDGQNVPSDIIRLLKAYTLSKDIYLVGGIRIQRKDSLVKILASKIANKIRSLLLNDDCLDTGCGLKVFSRKVFMKLPILLIIWIQRVILIIRSISI